MPEELSESWERFQRALHEWGGRLWERLGPRGAREDRPVISQMLNNKEALGFPRIKCAGWNSCAIIFSARRSVTKRIYASWSSISQPCWIASQWT